MAKRTQSWLLLIATLLSLSARAEVEDAPRVLPFAPHGLFTGDQWRFKQERMWRDLPGRWLADLVAIPTGIPWWSGGDWVVFGSVVGTSAALSLGWPSVDVRLDSYLQYQLLGQDHFKVWGVAGDLIIWGSTGLIMLGVLLYGLLANEPLAVETTMLMLEAVLVENVYHIMIKLLLGRAGPQRPELEGQYFGPTRSIELFPEGQPSGHMMGMYALLSVAMHMLDHPLAWVGLNLFALVFAGSLVGDVYHWFSDVFFGGAIGFCVGRWIVRHRSTHYVYGVDAPKQKVSLDVMPLIFPRSGGGLAVVGTF